MTHDIVYNPGIIIEKTQGGRASAADAAVSSLQSALGREKEAGATEHSAGHTSPCISKQGTYMLELFAWRKGYHTIQRSLHMVARLY